MSGCRGGDKHTTHTQNTHKHTSRPQHVDTLYPPPEQFTCRRLSAPPFTASPSPLLPARIYVSSLDFIDQTSGAKWSRPKPRLPAGHLSSCVFFFHALYSLGVWNLFWSSVWVNTGLKAAAGSFTKAPQKPGLNCSEPAFSATQTRR